jgi:magnesium transporter
MKRRRGDRPLGLRPDDPLAHAEPHIPKSIHLFHYAADALEETDVAFVEDIAPYIDKPGVTWVNVDGLGNPDIILEMGKVFGLHPLALEDVLSARQRPKVDDYGTSLYIVIRMLRYEDELQTEQVSLFLGPNFLVTFFERPGDCLEPVRERLRKGVNPLRREGADCLMHAVVDAIVDNYFPFLERLGELVEDMETEVLARPSRSTLARVHDIRRDLLDVRRCTWPLRDAVSSLLRDENPLVGKATQLYLRDCCDHVVFVIDVLEAYRELIGQIMEVYVSTVNTRLNEVIKVLTVVATIFIPLTFIASLYGMNFKWMPELNWPWGYPAVWGVMILVTVGMLLFFRHKGWLGGGKGH